MRFAFALIAYLLPQLTLAAPALVSYRSQYHPGTIEVHQQKRELYLVVDSGRAIRYRVAVPKKGKEWFGYARVYAKYRRPDWSPPEDVRRDKPELPDVIKGGDPKNPMGEAAIMLDRGQYAIHGTAKHMRKSIGTAASYGCIRMLNEDVLDLYPRVGSGTLVVMLP